MQKAYQFEIICMDLLVFFEFEVYLVDKITLNRVMEAGNSHVKMSKAVFAKWRFYRNNM